MKKSNTNTIRITESKLKSLIEQKVISALNEISYDTASRAKEASYKALDMDPEDVKNAIALIYNVLSAFRYDVGPSNRMGGAGRQINDVIENFKVVDNFITRKLEQYENLESHEEDKYSSTYEEIGNYLGIPNPTKASVEQYLNNMSDEEYDELLRNLPRELEEFLRENWG